MKKLKNFTLSEYAKQLGLKNPTPGGGSAAAYVAALGTALISMVSRYSVKKGKTKSVDRKIEKIIKNAESIRSRLIELVDLDAQAYLQVVKTKKAGLKERKKALKKAREVPMEICRLCYKAIELTPFLVKEGSPYLLSDVRVAIEMLLAAYRSAMLNVEINK